MTTKNIEDFVPQKASGLLERVNEGPTISIMDLENEESLFVLDGLSAELWQLIDGKKSLLQIKQKLNQKKNLPARFSQDVAKLIQDLKQEKLLQ